MPTMLRRWLLTVSCIFVLVACSNTGGERSLEAVADPTAEADPEVVVEDIRPDDELVVYSGRSEALIGPLIEQFKSETGISVGVRYGDTAEMAATILEEGQNSPADVYYAQDAGALGALAEAGVLAPLPESILGLVEERFRSPEGLWVGISGRARVVAYNKADVDPSELPDSIFSFTDPLWQSRIGWVPTNGSFQAFVTAMRVLHGEETTREWLQGIIANNPVVYPNNSVALEGVAAGEVDVAFINHYYLLQAVREQGVDFGADIYFPPGGDVGSLMNVSGAAMLATSQHQAAAERFIEFLLSREAQEYFATSTFEYPLLAGVEPDPRLPTLSEIQTPEIDLSNLDDLQGTLQLLQDVGALE